ncbi:MAG: TAT-variant-translocated molybdopterin oxidoreductase [Candidatus Solibacter usitatus]|nr:TAT-variant-translocated molybdopterin oxidoreductase [Candidatus Solibacter usitatus]
MLHLDQIRRKLEAERGPRYWQSLEELAETEGFQEFLYREFPRQASEWEGDEAGRRRFLKLMGASLALAGLTACTRQPDEKIVPYVRQPEEIVPGKPLFFATAFTLGGAATGVLVESHMGRPTKIEGNPDHPASLGAADAITQASVLGLYDPDRSQTVTRFGQISSWDKFTSHLREALADQKAKQGAGMRILTEVVTSPALGAQIQAFLKAYPQARWHQYEPAHIPLDRHYNIEHADVILALDSDFLTSGPGHLRYARAFADRRRVRGERTAMNRLYAVEPSPTPTGAKADHRWAARASEMEGVAAAIAGELGIGPRGQAPKWAKAVAADLASHKGSSLVIAGPYTSARVQALADAMNQALGNVGKTVIYTEPVEARLEDPVASLRALTGEIQGGTVEMLLIVGGNPAYNAPADVAFRDALSKVKLRIRLGLYEDETSEACQWHIPEAHYLESWSDTRAFDGAVTIQQPLIAPLYRGKSAHELLAACMDQPERGGYDIVKSYWQTRHPAADFEGWWRKAVHDGVVPGTAAAVRNAPAPAMKAESRPAVQGLEIVFRPDPCVHDGRFSNNGWLQELPKPLTKLTWDNAALLSVATAERLGLQSGDEVELQLRSRRVTASAWILPGQANDSVTVHLGYGRTRAGRVGAGAGFNAYALRASDALWSGGGLELRKTGRKVQLAVTHGHWQMEGRAIVRSAPIEEYKKEPAFARHMEHAPPKELSLYPEIKYEGHAWGMAIDLTACNGCNACVVACQSENNIPVVGKDQVAKGREMHWIRVDRYFEGSLDHPAVHHQPVLCMHCENAPCEVVCPVAATVHSSEGLNDMVYNRCVGTRYCSHNCPYKVRRFNFLLYSDFVNETVAMQKNPDVTVRSRGVMEKCSYCVQRINAARIEAEKEDREVRDGEIQTACQQTCPTQAIVFGNLNDVSSRVAKMKAEELNYGLLADLNTRPRTTYLASLSNPNPEIEA